MQHIKGQGMIPRVQRTIQDGDIIQIFPGHKEANNKEVTSNFMLLDNSFLGPLQEHFNILMPMDNNFNIQYINNLTYLNLQQYRCPILR